MARQRLRAEQWMVLIDQWRTSGLSLPMFCERNGICPGTMRNWVYKPGRKHAVEKARRAAQASSETPIETAEVVEPTPAFLPVKLVEVAMTEPKEHAAIEVLLRAGRRIRVRRGFDPDTLRQVVAVLEG